MLRLKNIRKVFNEGTVNEKVALDGVTLTVEDGEFATIVGSNGAGKSTLFNCIGGSFFADEGSIYLDDRNITYVPEHKRAAEIGRLFQDPMKGTAPHMTIEENLSLAYLRAGQKKSIFFKAKQCRPGNVPRTALTFAYGAGGSHVQCQDSFVRRTAAGTDASDGDTCPAQDPAAR